MESRELREPLEEIGRPGGFQIDDISDCYLMRCLPLKNNYTNKDTNGFFCLRRALTIAGDRSVAHPGWDLRNRPATT